MDYGPAYRAIAQCDSFPHFNAVESVKELKAALYVELEAIRTWIADPDLPEHIRTEMHASVTRILNAQKGT